VVFLFLRAPSPASLPVSEDDTESLPGLLSSGAASETPGKDNVSHAFRMQVARLEQRLAENPADTTALRELGRMQQDAHNFPVAVTYYEQYLALNPETRQVWLDLANTQAGLQQWPQAEKTIQALLERRPEDPSAIYNLGAIYANMERFEDAKSWWEKARDQQADTLIASKASASLVRLLHQPR